MGSDWDMTAERGKSSIQVVIITTLYSIENIKDSWHSQNDKNTKEQHKIIYNLEQNILY